MAVRPDTSPDTPPRNTAITKPRRKWNRLSDAARAEVADRYSAGETSIALAKEYGVAKSTILGILRANSVVVRHQPLTQTHVAEAARLYESGYSLSQVAEELKVIQETMRRAILKAGVVLREPTKTNQRGMKSPPPGGPISCFATMLSQATHRFQPPHLSHRACIQSHHQPYTGQRRPGHPVQILLAVVALLPLVVMTDGEVVEDVEQIGLVTLGELG